MSGMIILAAASALAQSVEAAKRLIGYHNRGQKPVITSPFFGLIAEARTGPAAASPKALTQLSTALDDLGPLAARVTELKREVLAGEAEVLKSILEKLVPLVPLLSKDYESSYRRELIILSKRSEYRLKELRASTVSINWRFMKTACW